MPQNVEIKPGDTLVSIANEHGFADWKYVWEQNSSLREKREDPNVLAPGDVLTVPDIRPKEILKATNEVHKFRVKKLYALVDIIVRDDHGFKLPNTRYEVRVSEEEIYKGTSNSEGRVCVALLPATKKAMLTVWPFDDDPEFSFSWNLSIGDLNPIVDKQGNATGDLSGIQARLNNLGFDAGPKTNSINDQTKSAIEDFQRYIGHETPAGELDDETRRLLESVHNSI